MHVLPRKHFLKHSPQNYEEILKKYFLATGFEVWIKEKVMTAYNLSLKAPPPCLSFSYYSLIILLCCTQTLHTGLCEHLEKELLETIISTQVTPSFVGPRQSYSGLTTEIWN